MTTATDMLAKYLAAEVAILEGKEVRLGDRSLKTEDLDKVVAGRREWERRVALEGPPGAPASPTFAGVGFALANFNSLD